METLASVLKENYTLNELILQDCGGVCFRIPELFKALACNTSLRKLDLSNNPKYQKEEYDEIYDEEVYGNDGFVCIADYLPGS